MHQNEVKPILSAWAGKIDQGLDIIAHDDWDTGYISSALEEILEDRANSAIQNDPVAHHLIELAEKAQNSGQELMGPSLTMLHLINLYLQNRIDGFGYYIMLMTQEGASFAEITVRPNQTTAVRAASKKINELLEAFLAEQAKQDSTEAYAEDLLQFLQKQLPIATDSQHSGPIVEVKMERQGFIDGKRAHSQFLYSPNAEVNALSYSSYETFHYRQLVKTLRPDQVDKLCDLLLVNKQACRQQADQLADRIKARSGEDNREAFYLSNLSRALGRCDREDFYRIYSEVTEG